METKNCGKCKTDKPIKEFWAKGKNLQPNCIPCQSTINKERYNSNKSRHIKQIIKRAKQKRDNFYEWKKTLKCSCCSENYFRCLDFHHLDPDAKEYTVSSMLDLVGVEKIITEVEKCIVLCKNCHTKFHYDELILTEEIITNNKISGDKLRII